ncbi:MAG: PaREP1 family protein [Thermoproteus sp.]
MQIIHPWRDLKRYAEIRLEEALAEADLSLRFLEEGLHRNAAGKAFQAWKAALAAAAASAREALRSRFGGRVSTREGYEVELVDWLIALMPTGRMWEAARALRGVYGDEVVLLTAIALNLHEVQYNGDESGVLSRYSSLEQVEEDVKELVERTRKFVEEIRRRLSEAR